MSDDNDDIMSDEEKRRQFARELGARGGAKNAGKAKNPGSGRKPGSINKKTAQLREYANQHSTYAVDCIVDVLREARKAIANKDHRVAVEMMHVVLKASDMLLDRAIGKPSQTFNVFEKFDFNKATLADLEQLAARLEQSLGSAAIAAVSDDQSGDSTPTTH